MNLLRMALLAIAAIAVAATAVFLINQARFDRMVTREVRDFLQDVKFSGEMIDVRAQSAWLPPPVQRFVLQALGPQTKRITTFVLRHGGEFFMKPGAPGMPMEAIEYFRVDRPGYLWHAKIRMAPLLWFNVRDYYRGGKGGMLGMLASTFTVVDQENGQIALGALIRWASEATWFPQALMNHRVFAWEPIDDHTARARVSDSSLAATLVYRFTEDGWPAEITTEDRPLEMEGKSVKATWTAMSEGWHEQGGHRVPSTGKATWSLPSGPYEYVRVKMESFEYDWMPDGP